MFEVVFICTGNRNRSPLAEAGLRRALEGVDAHVHSVGLMDLGGAPVLPETLEVAAELGLDVTGHCARCIADVDLSEADLVLGLELEHAAAAVVDHRASPERTFTLLELLEVLRELPPSGGAAEDPPTLLARAHEFRRQRPGLRPGVADPFGGPARGFTEMGRSIAAACDELAERLFGARSTARGKPPPAVRRTSRRSS